MAIASIQSQPKVKAEDIPLEKLATSKTLTEEQKSAEAARQFEAMLVRQVLTQAQKPAFKSKYTSTGVSSAIYQDMMVNEFAEKISSSRTLGLAQELGAQFSRHSDKVPSNSNHKVAVEAKPTAPQHRNLRYDKAASL